MFLYLLSQFQFVCKLSKGIFAPEEFSHLASLTTHISSFVGAVQNDDCTLGHGVERYIQLRQHILAHRLDLLPADRKKVDANRASILVSCVVNMTNDTETSNVLFHV